jgi:hypothetical protein
MMDLIVERIKHDLSWRGVESSVWHRLASAGVGLREERLSVATVAQARRKARFVAMVFSIANPEAPQAIRTLGISSASQCDGNHKYALFSSICW